jgi:hypothetical protein
MPENLRPFKINSPKFNFNFEFVNKKTITIALAVLAIAISFFLIRQLMKKNDTQTARIPSLEESKVSEKAAVEEPLLEQLPNVPPVSITQENVGESQTTSPNQALTEVKKQVPEKTVADLAQDVEDLKLKLDEANTKIEEQNTKFGKVLEEHLAQQRRINKDRLAKLNNDGTTKFDINQLRIVELNPNTLIILSQGKRISVKPGEALPNGVVFLAYDDQSRLLKTSAGMFHVE